MDIMQRIFEKATLSPSRVAFPEATEEKMLKAMSDAHAKKMIEPVLVGDPTKIKAAAKEAMVSIEGIELVDAFEEEYLDDLIEEYLKLSQALSAKSLKKRALADPLFTALMMEAVGRADCTFAGISHTTGEVIAASQLIIGLREGVTTPSSVGIFDIPNYDGPEENLIAFGDSAVCVSPADRELADIAISACDTVKSLLGWQPRCAMLSYSTDGSAEGEMVSKIRNAVKLANKLRPDLKIDGEFQLDTAIAKSVANKKLKRDSEVAGRANIIIWPDLNVGNIGVKLVQQFAKADAYGPLLQGFAKPVGDCSRGAPASELVGNIAMLSVLAKNGGNI